MRELVPITTTADLVQLIESDYRLASPHTRRAYETDLMRFNEWRGGQPLTKTTVETYLAHLRDEGAAPATVNRAASALRWLARRLSDITRESDVSDQQRTLRLEAMSGVRDVRNVPDVRPPKGRAVPSGEFAALMGTTRGNSVANIRDGAILALAWTAGLRRSELVGLIFSDLTETEHGYTLRIEGKGGKVRDVPAHNGAARALADWLALRGDDPGPLFLRIDRNRRDMITAPLSDTALGYMLKRRAKRAGVPSLTWHDLRRTVAGDLLDAGVDIATVARLLGHSSVTTTQRYDRRGERAVVDAVAHRHVPYPKREL